MVFNRFGVMELSCQLANCFPTARPLRRAATAGPGHTTNVFSRGRLLGGPMRRRAPCGIATDSTLSPA